MSSTTQSVLNPNLLSELKAREIVYQTTEAASESESSLDAHLKNTPITLYCGFDPSADSLHVGSLFPLLTLKRFQDAGHRPIIILGGATGLIGDPSFKAQERSLLSTEQVEKNLAGIREVASRFLNFDPKLPNAALIINNADFYENLNVLTFLRDIGKHFSVNTMMSKDSVRTRMEDRGHGISFTEFSYTLLQAYDYYVLNQEYNCSLQIGASDQWGNITAGTDLIRRALAQKGTASPAFGLTHPLITRSDGQKFGKTEQGTIWLSADKTSPYQLYQFFISAPDDQVISWLQYLSFLPMEEILELKAQMKSEPHKKAAQLALAESVTKIVHGEAELDRAKKATQALFGTEIQALDLRTLEEVFSASPMTIKSKSDLSEGMPLLDLLAETGLFQSKGAARKEMTAGGVYLNNERISDANIRIEAKDLIADAALVLRKGKKNYHLVKFE